MILKDLFAGLLVISFWLLFLLLSGCFKEATLIFVVDIKNELKSSINYCQSFELPSCERVVEGGGVYREYYMESGSKFVYNPEIFNYLWVDLCGAPVRVDKVISINPVVQTEMRTFEVLIDQRVYRKFCSH